MPGKVNAEEGVNCGEEGEDDGVEVPVVVEFRDRDVEDENGVGADEQVNGDGQGLVEGRVQNEFEGWVVTGVVWLGYSRLPGAPSYWPGSGSSLCVGWFRTWRSRVRKGA